MVVLTLIPLSIYLFLPVFNSLDPPYAYIRIDSTSAFLDLVLARTYQSGLFRGGLAALPGRIAEFGGLLARQFGPLGLVLGVGGWVTLLWKKREVAWVLLAGMLAEGAGYSRLYNVTEGIEAWIAEGYPVSR